jgi:predicted transglutaminase-like cysteine proteinase
MHASADKPWMRRDGLFLSVMRAAASCLGGLRLRLLRAALLPACLFAAAVCPSQEADWQRMILAATRLGPGAVEGAQALEAAMAALRPLDEAARVHAVNRFYNRRLRFQSDQDVWAQADYWASPLESLQRGAGDCEDFAIAKYFTLVALGVPHSKLRLVYVRASIGAPASIVQAHMVLAYYASPDAVPSILDNLVDDVRPASQRPDLTPVFSFNAEGLWQGDAAVPAGDMSARSSRWQTVLAKARQEGFL